MTSSKHYTDAAFGHKKLIKHSAKHYADFTPKEREEWDRWTFILIGIAAIIIGGLIIFMAWLNS